MPVTLAVADSMQKARCHRQYLQHVWCHFLPCMGGPIDCKRATMAISLTPSPRYVSQAQCPSND